MRMLFWGGWKFIEVGHIATHTYHVSQMLVRISCISRCLRVRESTHQLYQAGKGYAREGVGRYRICRSFPLTTWPEIRVSHPVVWTSRKQRRRLGELSPPLSLSLYLSLSSRFRAKLRAGRQGIRKFYTNCLLRVRAKKWGEF